MIYYWLIGGLPAILSHLILGAQNSEGGNDLSVTAKQVQWNNKGKPIKWESKSRFTRKWYWWKEYLNIMGNNEHIETKSAGELSNRLLPETEIWKFDNLSFLKITPSLASNSTLNSILKCLFWGGLLKIKI